MRVIVVGAGLFGISTAYFLAERGHEVVVVDRGRAVAGECSFANGGIVHAGNAAPWSRPGVLRECLAGLGRSDAPLRVRLSVVPAAARWGTAFLRSSRPGPFEVSLRANARLAAYSLEQLRALRRRLDLPYDASARGCLVLYRRQAALQAALAEAETLAEEGVRCEPVPAERLAEREPALSRMSASLAGALYYPDDESGDACAFAQALAQHAEARGVSLRLGTTVRALATTGGAVTGVVTEQDRLEADACVLAAGSASPHLLEGLGLRLPIQPVKGYSITLPCAGRPGLPAVPFIDTAGKFVLSVLGDRLRIAGFAELSGYDSRPDPRRIRALYDRAAACLPGVLTGFDPDACQPWAGLRPTTADGRPVLGTTPVEGLFLATGAGHLGWTFAAGAGCFVADTVEGRQPALDPAVFGYRRLSS